MDSPFAISPSSPSPPSSSPTQSFERRAPMGGSGAGGGAGLLQAGGPGVQHARRQSHMAIVENYGASGSGGGRSSPSPAPHRSTSPYGGGGRQSPLSPPRVFVRAGGGDDSSASSSAVTPKKAGFWSRRGNEQQQQPQHQDSFDEDFSPAPAGLASLGSRWFGKGTKSSSSGPATVLEEEDGGGASSSFVVTRKKPAQPTPPRVSAASERVPEGDGDGDGTPKSSFVVVRPQRNSGPVIPARSPRREAS